MAIQHHRIPLRGSEPSIDLFTSLLKEVKENFGLNSADVLLECIRYWQEDLSASNQVIMRSPGARERTETTSHAFYLQLLTTTEIQCRINEELEKLRRDVLLKSILSREGIGRNEFLLEALILLLQLTRSRQDGIAMKNDAPFKAANLSLSSSQPISYLVYRPLGGNNNSNCNGIQQNSTVAQQPFAARQSYGRDSRSAAPESLQEQQQLKHHQQVVQSNQQHQVQLQPQQVKLQRQGRVATPTIETVDSRSSSLPPPEYRSSTPVGTSKNASPAPSSMSWRQRLRQQQLDQNRQLCEMVRRHSGKRYERTSSGEGRAILRSRKHIEPINNNPQWTPVHQEDIRKKSLGSSGSQLTIDSNKENASPLNNLLNFTNQHKRPTAMIPSTEENDQPPAKVPTNANFRAKGSKGGYISDLRSKFDLNAPGIPSMTLKERKQRAERLNAYLMVSPPEQRPLPGFPNLMSASDRVREGLDCDVVFPGIVLGNGATLKKKDYLARIGVTHILNAAEFRGVNIGEEFFSRPGDETQFKGYKGLRIEDTPQTQICRYFMDTSEFLDEALSSSDPGTDSGKSLVFVNCVFGKSRSTTCIIAYLMIKHGWDAAAALQHVRKFRPVVVNSGFLTQLTDLDHKLQWLRSSHKEP